MNAFQFGLTTLLLCSVLFLQTPSITNADTSTEETLSLLQSTLIMLRDSLSGVPVAHASSTDTIAPTTPSNFSGEALTDAAINLKWSRSTDNVAVLGYRIYMDGVKVGASNNTTHTVLGLSPDTAYTFTLTAYDRKENESLHTGSITVTTKKNSLVYTCSDGLDNDDDGKTDYPSDPGCKSKTDTDEYNSPKYCSYEYSEWGTCQSNNTQTRTVESESPSNCIEGTPILIQACTYNAPKTSDTLILETAKNNTSEVKPLPTNVELMTQEEKNELREQLLTRIAELQQLIVELTAQRASENTGDGPYEFTKDLKVGDTDQDVVFLQKKLNNLGFTITDSGAGSPGQETTYYGFLTVGAVQRFQCAYDIICDDGEDAHGYGYFGPATRAKLSEL